MNETQIKLLGAFEATMQTFVSIWEIPECNNIQCAAAYGGASAMLLLLLQCGWNPNDIMIIKAQSLLNEAAKDLNLPSIN